MRILYIQASFVPPPQEESIDRFQFLSETLEGDILQPVWFERSEEVERSFGPGTYPAYRRGRFNYHWFLAWRHGGLSRKLATLWFYVQKGRELCQQHRYDCMVVYSHMTTGMVGVLLKLLTGTPLVIEIVTAPDRVCITERPHPTLLDRLRKLYSDVSLHVSVLCSDRTHLLYPDQLRQYSWLRNKPQSVFHEFVPVSAVPRRVSEEEATILLVGAPWYLKGVDLLITAFRNVVREWPELRLKILGHYPDRAALEQLTGGIRQIEILKAVPNPEALRLISQAMVFVLPSRCEGLPRVLLEAMAAAGTSDRLGCRGDSTSGPGRKGRIHHSGGGLPAIGEPAKGIGEEQRTARQFWSQWLCAGAFGNE